MGQRIAQDFEAMIAERQRSGQNEEPTLQALAILRLGLSQWQIAGGDIPLVLRAILRRDLPGSGTGWPGLEHDADGPFIVPLMENCDRFERTPPWICREGCEAPRNLFL